MKCATCSLCRAFSSFGRVTTHGYQCVVTRQTLFQMTTEDAEQYFLPVAEIGYYAWWQGSDVSLKRLLPSGFGMYDAEWEDNVRRLLLGDHPCILGNDEMRIPSAASLVEEYEGYVTDRREKVERENEELARLLRTLDRLKVVEAATTQHPLPASLTPDPVS